MARVIHFDIEADDPERAMNFYREVFDWTFERWDGPMDYWLITTGPPDQPGIDGGLARRNGPAPTDDTPTAAFTCTIAVTAIETVLEQIDAEGGRVADGVQSIPDVGTIATCWDTEDNRFGIIESAIGGD